MQKEGKPILQSLNSFIKERAVAPSILKRLTLALVIFWVPVVLFIAIADEIHENEPIPGDSAALQYLNQFASPTLDRIVIFLTDTSGPLQIVVIAAILTAVLYYLKMKRAAILLTFGLGGAALINVLLKLFFARNRPDLWATVVTETSYSFPSGHAMGSSALAFSLMALAWNTKWRWHVIIAGSLYIFIIGLTRLYLGVHYPSDIIAGWLVSLAWVVLVKALLDHYKKLSRLVPFLQRTKP